MTQPNLAERGMAVGLRALNRLAGNGLIDRFGLREPAERVLHGASKATVRTATRAGRTFAATQKLSKPARQPRSGRSDLFDLTPDDEQQMLRESVRDFALAKLRPAGPGGRRGVRRPARAARPVGRARADDGRRPRGARRRRRPSAPP